MSHGLEEVDLSCDTVLRKSWAQYWVSIAESRLHLRSSLHIVEHCQESPKGVGLPEETNQLKDNGYLFLSLFDETVNV